MFLEGALSKEDCPHLQNDDVQLGLINGPSLLDGDLKYAFYRSREATICLEPHRPNKTIH